MTGSKTAASMLCALLALGWVSARAQTLATSPPLGWNSWDAYGFTLDEQAFKANATILAGIKRLGWTYAVIDEGWYMEDPLGDKLETRHYQLDAHGRLVPSTRHFPSATGGAGFKPLADWTHAQGLKFGIHIVRGIPKQAVHDNVPIAASSFHAADAADVSDTCPWDDANYGVRDDATGQAYYDSMLQLYADWGLDFIKVDCIADHPYKATEIRQIAAAIHKTGRPIVLSLSPGPTQLSHAAEVSQYAQLWRIADDTWDGWHFTHDKANSDFPNGVLAAFDNLAQWAPFTRPGHWPDADMLPFGSLTPHPGWGEPRQSRLTHDEERTQFVLWAIARSPLILGANLTQLDDFTRALITHKELLQVNQQAWDSHPLTDLPQSFAHARAWVASTGPRNVPERTVALFNLDDQPLTLQASWIQLHLAPATGSVRPLLDIKGKATAAGFDVVLPPHGCVVYRLAGG
jgi:alpha-galactosidase